MVDKTAEQMSAEEKAAREAEDERVRKHGQEIAQRALRAVNQPMKPPMTLAEVCSIWAEAGGSNIVVAVPKKIMVQLDFPMDAKPPHGLGQYWGSRLLILPGPQEMPDCIANHWWVRANGVKPYTAPPVVPRETYTKAEMQEEIKKAVDAALALQQPAKNGGDDKDKGDNKGGGKKGA